MTLNHTIIYLYNIITKCNIIFSCLWLHISELWLFPTFSSFLFLVIVTLFLILNFTSQLPVVFFTTNHSRLHYSVQVKRKKWFQSHPFAQWQIMNELAQFCPCLLENEPIMSELGVIVHPLNLGSFGRQHAEITETLSDSIIDKPTSPKHHCARDLLSFSGQLNNFYSLFFQTWPWLQGQNSDHDSARSLWAVLVLLLGSEVEKSIT